MNAGSISLRVLVFIAWQNLVRKKLRTFLTVIGVVIGIGAISFLMSFGIGLRDLVTKEVIGNQSVKSIEVSSPNSKLIKLDQTNVSRIQSLPHVGQLGASFSNAGALSFKGGENDAVVYGVDRNYQELTNLNLLKGRLIENKDNKVAIVNIAALQNLKVTEDQIIDKEVRLRIPVTKSDGSKTEISDAFKIIGLIDSGGGTEVFIPNFVFENSGVGVYSQLKLVVDDNQYVESLRQQIESIGFETNSPSDTIEQINQIFQFFTIMLVSFGAVGMIVAVLGMFNTLTISLLERTKEIGLMVALGARSRDMRKLFIIEALILSVVGAAVGILSSAVLGSIINVIMNSFAKNRGVTQSFDLFSMPAWLVLSLIGFMSLVGLCVVYFPARRAEKIDPIDALRRE